MLFISLYILFGNIKKITDISELNNFLFDVFSSYLTIQCKILLYSNWPHCILLGGCEVKNQLPEFRIILHINQRQ